MSRLLSASFMRLIKDKIFWLCNLAMLGLGTLYILLHNADMPPDSELMKFALLIGLITAVLVSMFIGTEYSDGTIRNKIITGKARTTIYFANLITNLIAALSLCAFHLLPVFALGIPLYGSFSMDIAAILKLIGIALAMTAAFTSISTFVSMLVQNKALTVVLNVMIFAVLLMISSWFYSALSQPEMDMGYSIITNENGEVTTAYGDPQPNPYYISGKKREVYEFIIDCLPSGQSLTLVEGNIARPLRMVCCSMAILVLTTAGGVILFKRKDLK